MIAVVFLLAAAMSDSYYDMLEAEAAAAAAEAETQVADDITVTLHRCLVVNRHPDGTLCGNAMVMRAMLWKLDSTYVPSKTLSVWTPWP